MTSRPAALLVDRPVGRSGQLSRDPDLWRQDQALASVADLLPTIKVLSLDVFDTLLFRTCGEPDDVFLEVGRRAHAAGLLGRGFSPAEFANLRRTVQVTTYATLGREPRLEDIYAGLPLSIGPLDQLLKCEEETEADFCVLNPSIDSLVSHCNDVGIPVVLLSDMYLGEARVRGLLKRAGFIAERRSHRVIVSVDAGDYKMTGGLYRRLRDLFPAVAPAAMLHIGDNVHADVAAARAAGLRAVHYDVVRHDPDGTHAIERLVCGELLPELSFLRRLARSMGAGTPSTDQAWHRAGAGVVGPFVAALVDWTLDQCVADGITLVAPLMREGHLLAPLLRRAAQARAIAIKVEPLYVSRQAVAIAGIDEAKSDLVARVFDGRRHFSVADVFAAIGAGVPSAIEAHRDVLTTSADSVVVSPGTSLRGWIVAHLTGAELQPSLERRIAEERGRLVSYLDGVFKGHRAVATLDVGFYAQIQRSIDTALVRERRPVRIAHLLGFGHGPVRDHVLQGRDVRVFAGGYGNHGDLVATIHRSAPVLEQLLQGLEGTTTGYVTETGRTTPRCEDNPLPTADLARKAIVQQGVYDYQDLWIQLRRSNPALVDALVARREAWCRLVHRLIDVPSCTEAAALGDLHDDVNFGSSTVLPFCPTSSEADVARIGPEIAYRRGAGALPVIWPQGLITRVDPGAIIARHADASRMPYAATTVALVRALRARRVTRVVGYGTGDVAVAFVEAARMLGIEVVALVDSHPSLHGLRVRDIPVCSLDAAIGLGVHVYAVLSVAHAGVIGDAIGRRYASEPVAPLILSPSTTP